MRCLSQSQLAWGEGDSAAWGVVLQSAGYIGATFNSAYGQLLGVSVGVTRRSLWWWEGEVRKWRGLGERLRMMLLDEGDEFLADLEPEEGDEQAEGKEAIEQVEKGRTRSRTVAMKSIEPFMVWITARWRLDRRVRVTRQERCGRCGPGGVAGVAPRGWILVEGVRG
jgi:hypothetical protein